MLSIAQNRLLALCSMVAAGAAVVVADEILGVGLEIAVGVLHQPQVRRLADEHALIEHLERARQHQLVGEHRALVHHAVAVRVFEDGDVVDRLARIRAVRLRHEARHLEHPHAARRRRSRSRSDRPRAAPSRPARRDSRAAGRRSSAPPPPTASGAFSGVLRAAAGGHAACFCLARRATLHERQPRRAPTDGDASAARVVRMRMFGLIRSSERLLLRPASAAPPSRESSPARPRPGSCSVT